jgi:hypothetical protein
MTGWLSAEGANPVGQWVELRWTTPMTATQVTLIGPPPMGGDWGGFGSAGTPSPYHITSGTLQFYYGGAQVGSTLNVAQVQALEEGGTTINLAAPLKIDRLRFTVQSITGKWHWANVAALNEIEVLGMAAAPAFHFVYLPGVTR